MNIKQLYTSAHIQNQPMFQSNNTKPGSLLHDKNREQLICNPINICTSKSIQDKKQIYKKLEDIEKTHNIKIIYACEAGSRAWGSDSKYSDYDVRFIYVSPKSKYQNSPQDDFINAELNETFDMVGFDISKIIKMVKNGDKAPYEMMNSTVKYKETDFSKELHEMINESCDTSNLQNQYISSAKALFKKMEKQSDNVSIKTYLLCLKYILAAEYIKQNDSASPLQFQKLFDECLKDEKGVYSIANTLLRLKRNNKKDITMPHNAVLDRFIESKIDEYDLLENKLTANTYPVKNFDNFFEETINSPEFNDINKIRLTQFEKERFNKFPKDIDYKKQLLDGISKGDEDVLVLNSIVGPQELEYVLNKYNDNSEAFSNGMFVDERSGKTLMQNVISKTFRANLHIHTNHSDGEMSVQELLDSSAKYADGIVKQFKKKGIKDFEPFTIAITDHNTTDGAKEAVRIISNNPEKYKNLRVVLGIELSATEKDKNGKNLQIHILAQGINPFEEKINEELLKKRDEKIPLYKSLGSISDVASMLGNQPNCIFGYAHPFEHISQKLSKKDQQELVMSMIDGFKEATKGHVAYVENYYQSYNNPIGQDTESIKTIRKYSDGMNLYSAGGYDSHGNSVFAE